MRRTTAVTAAGAALAAAVTVPAGPLAAVPALLGGVGTLVGTVRGARRLVSLGALALVGGVLVGGHGPLPPGLVLVGTVGAVLAWDAAEYAIGLDEQLTTSAETARAEAAHLGATTIATAGLATLGYAAWLFGRGVFPSLTAVVLGVAVVLLGTELAGD